MSLREALLGMVLAGATASAGCRGGSEAASQQTATAIDEDKQAAAKLAVESVESGPVEAQPALAAGAILEIDRDSLPSGLAEGLEVLAGTDRQDLDTMLAKTLYENSSLLTEVCGDDAQGLLKSAAEMQPDDAADAIWNGCDMERHGLISKADRPDVHPHAAIVTHMVFVHVSKERLPSPEFRTLLQASLRA